MHLLLFFIFSKVLFCSFAMPSKDRVRRNKKKDMNKCYYETNKDAILSDRKEKYDKEKRSERHNDDYYRNVLASRIKSAESTKVHYHKDVDESRVKSAERVRDHYHKDLEKSRAESAQTTKKHYLVHIDELCKKAKHRYDLLYYASVCVVFILILHLPFVLGIC